MPVSTFVASRAFTGAWIETIVVFALVVTLNVAPSRARGLKLRSHRENSQPVRVAPSRARGLKHLLQKQQRCLFCRAFTGAWIETSVVASSSQKLFVAPSRARGLKPAITSEGTADFRRAFTGAWIETRIVSHYSARLKVAPSRARGLKLQSVTMMIHI